ncbi:unnamed protein product [Adineta ricciae]|uniref:DDE Tnp4 domain-containing protein n=1 Tax=Adineta ricciae TaxID=249248 RepID=A0A814YWZ6_ADIRI|nr:unnamed protein product [Adineta ricciae]CAF1618442.1 unnamed protein product [Adineta ricciae]
MDKVMFLGALHSYLIKKKNLKRQIVNINSELQHQRVKKRRALLLRNILVFNLNFLIDQSLNTHRRAVWSYPKSGEWWSDIVPNMTEKQFKDNFRIQRSTFAQLVDRIGKYVKKEDTVLRLAIPVDKRIACALYLLGTTGELRTIGHLFGIGKCSAANILHDFCYVIVELYFHCLIKFPTTQQEIKATTDAFLKKFNYPMCLGALDGTHIAIEPPIGFEPDYYNYKKHHSIILLAAVDSSLKFTYVNVGAPGRCNDANVYSRSSLYELLQGNIYTQNYITINNTRIQSHIIADSAFPLSKYLMKPYTERYDMPRDQSVFNYRLSHCRCSIERAFGHLKNRFRSIHKKMEYDITNVKTIIKATCILHNICIDAQDSVEIDWDIGETIYRKPTCATQTTASIATREALTQYFSQNPI